MARARPRRDEGQRGRQMLQLSSHLWGWIQQQPGPSNGVSYMQVTGRCSSMRRRNGSGASAAAAR